MRIIPLPRPTIVIASLVQFVMGMFAFVQVVSSGHARPLMFVYPGLMIGAAIGGFVVQHPSSNVILRPFVIGANALLLVMSICSFAFLFAESVAYYLPGTVPPIGYVIIGMTIIGPIISNITAVMMLPPPRGGNLF